MSEHAAATSGDIRAQIRARWPIWNMSCPGRPRSGTSSTTTPCTATSTRASARPSAAARRITGTRGFLPVERFRAYYAEGRIDRADLEAVLAADPDLGADEPLAPGVAAWPRMRAATSISPPCSTP